jgi:hypothetical protein
LIFKLDDLAITENSKIDNCGTENNEYAMKSLKIYKEKANPNEYDSEFDFSEYLTNKKNEKNLNSNSISINDIQNFDNSCS